jgi:hypothetical protein
LRNKFPQRRGLFLYLLKGIDHSITTKKAGQELNVADLLGIEHRGTQGTVNCARYGVSQSLGPSTRKRSGWQELNDVLDLAAITNKAAA